MTIDDAQKKLRRALKRLAPEQGRLARKNARAAIAAAIRALRAAVDDGFPALKRADARVVRAAIKVGPKRLAQRGFVALYGHDEVTLRVAGVTIRTRAGVSYGPAWAVELLDMLPPVHRAGPRAVGSLRRAKKSASERRIVEAELAIHAISFDAAAAIGASRAQVMERVRLDPTFRDAVRAAARVPGMIQQYLANQYPVDDKTMGLRVVA